jgi:hypothetical protein
MFPIPTTSSVMKAKGNTKEDPDDLETADERDMYSTNIEAVTKNGWSAE